LDGKTQLILARRQLEHGESLSHLTLRLRHTTQLGTFEPFCEGDDEASADEPMFFSDAKAEAEPAGLLFVATGGTRDMMKRDGRLFAARNG
jgi:hypothetical protein